MKQLQKNISHETVNRYFHLDLEVYPQLKWALKRYVKENAGDILDDLLYLELDFEQFIVLVEMLVRNIEESLIVDAIQAWIAEDSTNRSNYEQALNDRFEQLSQPSSIMEPPRRPKTAFYLFCDEYKDQVQNSLGVNNIAIISKELGNRWKNLSEEQKRKYQEEYDRANRKYLSDLEEYNKNREESSSDSDNDQPPIRPLNGYLMFCQDQRVLLKQQNPRLSMTETTQLLSQMWRDADEQVKKSYNDASLLKQRKYNEQMQKFIKRAPLAKRRKVESDDDEDYESDE